MKQGIDLQSLAVLRPELRQQLARLEVLEKRERARRYERWLLPAAESKESDGWLITYLDLVTLLLVLLVTMLSFVGPGQLPPLTASDDDNARNASPLGTLLVSQPTPPFPGPVTLLGLARSWLDAAPDEPAYEFDTVAFVAPSVAFLREAAGDAVPAPAITNTTPAAVDTSAATSQPLHPASPPPAHPEEETAVFAPTVHPASTSAAAPEVASVVLAEAESAGSDVAGIAPSDASSPNTSLTKHTPSHDGTVAQRAPAPLDVAESSRAVSQAAGTEAAPLVASAPSTTPQDVGDPPVLEASIEAPGSAMSRATPSYAEIDLPALPTPDDARPLPTLEELGLADLGDDIDVIISQQTVNFRISNEILFESAQADLTEAGLEVLARLAQALQHNPHRLTIEGHTDNRPIFTNRFPSNWELSTTRATSVLRYLQRHGIAPERLRAVGYADTRPIATNETSAGRAANRRVEVIMEIDPEGIGSAPSPAPAGPGPAADGLHLDRIQDSSAHSESAPEPEDVVPSANTNAAPVGG